MNGLERRLRRVEGVADLTIELSDEGLDSIRVRINDGSDEAEVMEDIRRILVAYGLRSRRESVEPTELPELEGLPIMGAVSPMRPQVHIRPDGDGLEVELVTPALTVSETSERSPVGAAEAMVRAVARLRDRPQPSRISLALDELDGDRVITMLGRRGHLTAVSTALCRPTLADGLFRAADDLIRLLDEPALNAD